MRQKILLLAAVFFGVLAFMFTSAQLNSERKRIQGSVTDVNVIQAVKDLSEGDKITDDNIRVVKVKRSPNSIVSSNEIPGGRKDTLIGRQVMFFIPKDQALTWNDLKGSESSGRGGLSAKIPQGKRAISISVDSISSVNGLIQPNNHVDLIGTFKFPDLKGDSSYDTVTLTIFQNVVVLATGTDMGYQQDSRNPGASRNYSTVTLAVTPKEAELLIFATQKGRIQLSLRNYDEVWIEKDIQSVNWKYLQDSIKEFNDQREQDMTRRSSIK